MNKTFKAGGRIFRTDGATLEMLKSVYETDESEGHRAFAQAVELAKVYGAVVEVAA